MKNTDKLLVLLFTLVFSLTSSAQFLRRHGQKITDQNGNEVLLRGMGLGGWMLQEPYMMEMGGIASAQWEIKSKIKDLIGPTATDAFYKAWHETHCTRRDIDSLASWGFNSVRLPMHYNLYTLPVEDEPVPGSQTWLEEGFALTDSLIKWCSDQHMYVILDLHAAPGGQGRDVAICDGNTAKLSLWESPANKTKTIELWKKLAQRYVNEPWVGGYDLLNEPNWNFDGSNQNGCSDNTNAPLRQLQIDITNAIRQYDTRHMIIIEGNCWGGNYNGIFPAWDTNMVVSFHKYWSSNEPGSIQGMLNIRSQQNLPLWMGESGENSNVWFTDAISLVEKNGFGWAWWPLKKINSVVGPLTIVKTPQYQSLLDYWNNGGTKPSAGFATYTLMQMASNAKNEYCVYHKDVIDAMFRQVHDSTAIPFDYRHIPGTVNATDYDLGRFRKAYFDTDVSNPNVSTGDGTDWNKGYSYRNDGVDIEPCSDPDPSSNGFDIGWTDRSEWLQYTVTVDSTAAYNASVRYAGFSGSVIRLSVNESDITGTLNPPSTGGSQVWKDLNVNDVILYKGKQRLRLLFDNGGINLGFLGFSLSKKTTEVPLKPVSAATYRETSLIYASFNKQLADSTVSAPGFILTVNGAGVNIASLSLNTANPSQIIINPSVQFTDFDTIELNYSNGYVKATDGTSLENFVRFPVQNNLPLHYPVPGKIEAENFSLNQGLQLEPCSDIGGGLDLGYTNTGDYVDYRINVRKTGKYNMELRIACLSNAGIILVQQLNDKSEVLNSSTVNIPVTGGWQTWQSINPEISLTEGMGTLRIKIVQPEFNMNWYKFTEKTAVSDPGRNSLFSIYPNPARDELTVETPMDQVRNKTLSFRSTNGILIRKIELQGAQTSQKIFIGDLPRGFYVLELEVSGTVYRNKLIVQ